MQDAFNTFGYALFVTAVLMPAIYSYVHIRSMHHNRKRNQKRALANLATVGPNDPGREELVKLAFNLFDVDDSGRRLNPACSHPPVTTACSHLL